MRKNLRKLRLLKLKRKVKRNVKQSICTKKNEKLEKGVAAASILVGVSVAMLGIGFPTYAGGLPIVGDIFRFLDNGRTGLYENYKEFSTELNMTRRVMELRLQLMMLCSMVELLQSHILLRAKKI